MKIALVCTAKNEDNYIDEWIDYHFKIGIDDIFIYENQWNYDGKFKEYENVHLLYLEQNTPQYVAFNHFIKNFNNQFDFGIFLDCDEFICLKKHNNIEEFLNDYQENYGIGISTIIFGNNNIEFNNKNYSCIDRFTKRCKKPIREIKTILNFNICKDDPKFNCPHSIIQNNKIINANKTHFINGPFNIPNVDEIDIIQINHYVTKTFDEFKDKLINRGWCDTPNRKYTENDIEKIKDEFHNFHCADNFENNEIEDLTIKNLYNKKYRIKVIQYDNRDNEIIQLGKQINSKYCELNGYDYYFENFNFDINNYSDITEFCNNDKDKFLLAINYHKYELVLQYLNYYDYVIIIDSDAVFVNPFKKIEDYIDLKHDIYMSTDMTLFSNSFFIYSSFIQLKQYCDINKCNYIENFKDFSNNTLDDAGRSIRMRLGSIWANPSAVNAGFIIFKNSNNVLDLIDNLKIHYKIFAECCHDQGALAFLLHTNKFKKLLKVLPKYFQGDSLINLQNFKYDEDKNFINHVCGGKDKILNAFKDVKNNKYWSQIFKNENTFTIT